MRISNGVVDVLATPSLLLLNHPRTSPTLLPPTLRLFVLFLRVMVMLEMESRTKFVKRLLQRYICTPLAGK
eukprot:scaffold9231_cov130-Skeletonema_menzelii.AAC.2